MKKLIALVSCVGVVLAALSQYEHELIARGLQVTSSFCNINETFNCDKVNSSEYSKLFGLPLAGFGLGFYLTIFAATFFFSIQSLLPITFLLGLAASVFSIYLFYISKSEIGTLCILCMGMYLVNFILFLISFLKSDKGFIENITAGANEIWSKWLLIFPVLGIFIVSFLWPTFFIQNKVQKSSSNINTLSYDKSPTYSFVIDEGGNAISRDQVLGPKDAPITIVEFSDFECPACRHAFPIIESLLEMHKDKIRFIPKNFPLDKKCNSKMEVEGHKHACFAAELVRCAGEQDKFWEAYNFVFTSQAFEGGFSAEGVVRSLWSGIGSLGLDISAVDECVKSKRQMNKIQSDIKEGYAIPIKGTPSVFVNGRSVDLAELKNVVERLLK